ncbi:hypothetical protein ALNOE001_03380 [Candidatus Methanobinarius endosymbioticus]|uniref:Glyoxalase-like domain-containing protein n=1 Tax=Candidatus Methanobinarius endosymbioticus TaxID=2006182 RepID=A0A366MDG3_9EURY|nr:hypothetical protein ALNOE001_03380 [Candidatus Methanobinarius endosymbioticus]
MRFISSVLVGRDMERSRDFHENILNQKVKMDLGVNVSYRGFGLQTIDTWADFIDKDEKTFFWKKQMKWRYILRLQNMKSLLKS